MTVDRSDALNDGFVQMMYENWLANPASVEEEWQTLFRDGGDPASEGGTATAVVAPPAPPAAPPAAATAPAAAPAAPPAPPKADVPADAALLKGADAGLVKNMNSSLGVPTATTFRTVSVATLDAKRRELNTKLDGTRKLSFTHLVAWALIEGWMEVPVMGHVFQEINGKPYRIPHEHINFGLAVDVEKPNGGRGLLVPCVTAADTLGPVGFFDAYDGIVQKARTGSIGMADMIGTTVTLTNPGGLGTVASVPRLMQNQAAIIATGAINYPVEFQHLSKDELKAIGVAKVLQITSTYDHRVIQGAESGRYLQAVDKLLQGGNQFYERIADALGIADGAATGSTGAATAPPTAQPAAAAPTTETSAPVAAPSADGVAGNGHGPVPVLLEPGADFVPVHGDLLPEPERLPVLPAAKISVDEDQLASVAAAMSIVKAHRTHGHLAANLDPLGSDAPGDPALDPASVGLTDEIMRTIPAKVLRIGVEGETFADALPRLREKYSGTIAYEVEHISSHEQRQWLRYIIEAGEHRTPLDTEQKLWLLDRLTDVEAFERFVRRAYLTQKQFSIEGLDMMVPMLDLLVEAASEGGAHEVVIGMAHRGRLNVVSHVLGLPYDQVLRYFEAESRVVDGTLVAGGGTGDVKYHMGATSAVETATGNIDVTVMPNPSHLEVVNPVVEGKTRASQTLQKGNELTHDGSAAIPVLIHGDAAFAGQGVVPETLNLQALRGYTTGGTIHLISNNQVGFTTEPSDARSTRYASDMAKGFDMPIIHVNADDPEACLAAMKLAVAYRARFHQDVLIDLIGYRRHGHNEGDEPNYTQPTMYQKIKQHTRVRELFAAGLVADGLLTDESVQQRYDDRYKSITALHEAGVLALGNRDASELDEPTGDIIEIGTSAEPETFLSEDDIRRLSQELLTVPAGFEIYPKLKRILDKRAHMPDSTLDWGAAESLAYASLLEAGVNVRLSGQDSERGTFSHRHMMLHDANTGETFAPIQHLHKATGALEVYNSPLSELACLGFEYGYSIEAPDTLVLWEGQFGDFVNGAQIVSDQFITSGMVKWGLTSRLTLLLPHGYEGNGPEHSNARLSRWLESVAEGNIRVAQPSTAAQHFHLLRRQALIPQRRPLVIMTPKGYLKMPAAQSPLSDFTSGRFEWVIDDPRETTDEQRAQVKRLVFCSGKIYHDVDAHEGRADATDTAVVRIELLYPFPRKQVEALLASYPNVTEVAWAQEEPLNFGAFPHLNMRMPGLLADGVKWSYIGRPKRSSASEGYTSVHRLEQERITRQVLGLD
ncbi:MAG: multifunctional oxoglutarate decarboxylase/oxoglutarate dehydrogenase thiamine pyrophosphate-binding subunit/dihydrolipoyllysine-residue succinyltransferase subunit [Thermoleophilia bacterium]|nr:multifunctional oxoglutarate decarboxylase/oxoglutarate dehydrogenase thiamine pyrophosphate-binding subunit/dihydrolipoyllysine-residue succinyltransferase subunit [Thermoleophilia bacterium]